MYERVEIETTVFGRFIIVLAADRARAWSGARFVGHERGIPTGQIQIANFNDYDSAMSYALECGFEVIL
jgi:hypothetical protein